MNLLPRRRWGLAAVLSLASLTTWAEQPLWELGLGMATLRLPHYRGSDQAHTLALPLPFAVYRGRTLRADREGARAMLFESDRLDLDLSLAASAPTRSRDNRARSGMPNLAPTVEIGPNLNLALAQTKDWKFQLRVPVRVALTLQAQPRDAGWTAAPHLNLDLKRGDWNFGLLGGPLWGSRRMHARLYDVDPVYSSPTRAAYRSPGGWAGWQATAGVSRRFGDLWAGGFVRSDSLAGAAFADSPLVRRQHSLSLGMAFSWVFASSSQSVPDRD